MAERKVGVPIPPKKMERVAELIGMGLSHSETAGAAGVAERTVARILSKPEYRKMADDVRKRRQSVTVQAAAVVQDLLTAETHDGKPDMASRQRGAELVMKNPELLEHVEELADDDESMLPGVVLRFPWSVLPEYSLFSEAGDAAEAHSAARPNDENGITLPPAEDAAAEAAFADVEPVIEDEPEPEPLTPPADLDLEPPRDEQPNGMSYDTAVAAGRLPPLAVSDVSPPAPETPTIPDQDVEHPTPTGTDGCDCPPYPADAPYPACPHDLRGPPGVPGPTGGETEADLLAAFAKPSTTEPTIRTEPGGALVATYPEQTLTIPPEPVQEELEPPEDLNLTAGDLFSEDDLA